MELSCTFQILHMDYTHTYMSALKRKREEDSKKTKQTNKNDKFLFLKPNADLVVDGLDDRESISVVILEYLLAMLVPYTLDYY